MVTDANDQHPTFIHRVFKANVSEAADPGSTILILEATDGDTGINAKLRYSIEKGNEHRQFRLDEETGKLLVAKSLDFEMMRDYELEVKVCVNILPCLYVIAWLPGNSYYCCYFVTWFQTIVSVFLNGTLKNVFFHETTFF